MYVSLASAVRNSYKDSFHNKSKNLSLFGCERISIIDHFQQTPVLDPARYRELRESMDGMVTPPACSRASQVEVSLAHEPTCLYVVWLVGL